MPETRSTEGILFTLSRFISNIFNPINSLILYFVYFSVVNYHWKQAVTEFLPILLILIIPVISWIVWNVRKGNYSNMDVSNRIQRKSLYTVIIVLILCYLVFNFLMDKQIDYTMLFLFLLIMMMHFSNEHRFYGGHGIVGGQIPLGAGIAFADQYFDRKAVNICFFGDGAARQGSLHETFNMAMNWKLPVVFVVENNQYAMGTSVKRTANHEDIYKLGLGYEMPCLPIDAMDPEKVAEAAYEAIERARRGDGPTFIEARTYRYRGHSMSDAEAYRSKDEVELHKQNDPILMVKERILANNWATESELEEMDNQSRSFVEECIEFMENSPYPDPEKIYDYVYAQEDYPFLDKLEN